MNDAQWDVYLRREIKRREHREQEFKLMWMITGVWALGMIGLLVVTSQIR